MSGAEEALKAPESQQQSDSESEAAPARPQASKPTLRAFRSVAGSSRSWEPRGIDPELFRHFFFEPELSFRGTEVQELRIFRSLSIY